MKIPIRCFLFLFLASAVFGQQGEAFEFRDGDTVVLLGNTFVEREMRDGFIETCLTLGSEAKNVRFRNLGWSGDTVECVARSYFGPPQEGFDRLKANLAEFKPTAVIVSYGGVEAFGGDAALPGFVAGYERLVGMIKEVVPEARIALMSPPPCETLGAPLPDMGEQNARLGKYRDAIRELAGRQGVFFADLFAAMESRSAGESSNPLTDNGVHFTAAGYAVVAPKFAASLGWRNTLADLASPKAAALRALIVEKNELFFHRWRPENETYLFGFRKHEQGNNSVEIPKFDPLIAEKEAAIEAARTAAH
jgi:lysophospholipase L1-like esterase